MYAELHPKLFALLLIVKHFEHFTSCSVCQCYSTEGQNKALVVLSLHVLFTSVMHSSPTRKNNTKPFRYRAKRSTAQHSTAQHSKGVAGVC